MAGLPSLDELFEGRHFDREIIVLCVRWYLRFKLSFRDLVEMMTEGIVTLIQVRRRGTPHGCDARIISWPGICLSPPVVECINPDRAVGAWPFGVGADGGGHKRMHELRETPGLALKF